MAPHNLYRTQWKINRRLFQIAISLYVYLMIGLISATLNVPHFEFVIPNLSKSFNLIEDGMKIKGRLGSAFLYGQILYDENIFIQ